MVIEVVPRRRPRHCDLRHRHRQKQSRPIAPDRCVKILRSNPDNRERMPVDQHRLPDHLPRRAKMVSPVVVAQHHHRVRVLRRLIRRREQPARERPQSQHLEVVAAHHFRMFVLGLVVPGDAHARLHRRQHAAEYLIAVAQIPVHRVGVVIPNPPAECAHRSGEASVPFHPHQLPRPLYWQHAQQHLIEQREDRRRSTNSQRQRHYRGHRKSWRLPQLPPRISQITEHHSLLA